MAAFGSSKQGWPLPGTTLATGTTYSPWMVSDMANSISATLNVPAATSATNPTLDVSLETTDDPEALDTRHAVVAINAAVLAFTQITDVSAHHETKEITIYKATPDLLAAFTRVKAVVAADAGTPAYKPTVWLTMRP